MSKPKLRFKVKIEGREAGVVAAITPPIDVPEVFGTRARVPVRGSINGFPFRSSLMPMGGCHMMPVNRTLREAAGVKPGDMVAVVMERDDQVRTVDAPAVLKKALGKNKAAKGNWEKLPFTHKKEMAVWIEGAKQEETRVRRLAKVMHVLETGTKWTG
ncbi:MAG TPA: YdeI/OmpD-associated family protein [Candidatus Acidoferrales bacterium]|nr:YdeI/OmpD-associated family protein [Candidatus Acidoferrales bacterium]